MGGRREVQEGGDMYASGCFMLTYGRNQYNIAKQLSSNLKQILKKEVEITSVHSFKSIILLKLKKKKNLKETDQPMHCCILLSC